MPAPDLTDRSIAELLDLTGKRALVTGAGRGVGKSCARRLLEAGATVVFADIDHGAAQEALQELTHGEGKSIAVELDVSDPAAVARVISQAANALGGLDILINNAGVFPAAPVTDQPDAMWDRVIGTNLSGPYQCAKAAAPFLMEARGVIVNICSTESLKAQAPGLSAYVSSKHGLAGLTAALALEWGPAGVRVLGVAPTIVDTPGVAEMRANIPPLADVINQLVATLPMGRIAYPDDVARVVLFAVSGLAGMVTGSILLADGGAMLI